jgi:hypothetical protein
MVQPRTLSWVQLVYRLPREPSTPRIAVWRKLRRLGALQLVDGLVVLPRTDRNTEQLEWLAQEVVDAGGDASVWRGEPRTRDQARELERRARQAAADEYLGIVARVEAAQSAAAADQRTLRSLRAALREAATRDHFGVAERVQAERAVEALAATWTHA